MYAVNSLGALRAIDSKNELLVGESVFTGSVADFIIEGQNADNTRKAKAEAVANITVTTSTGKVFDGDEKSQARMMSALTAADTLRQTETTWILADTTGRMSLEERKALITITELKEAQALSIVALGKILGAID